MAKFSTALQSLTIEGVEFKTTEGVIELPDALVPMVTDWIDCGHLVVTPIEQDDGQEQLAPTPPPVDTEGAIPSQEPEPETERDPEPAPSLNENPRKVRAKKGGKAK